MSRQTVQFGAILCLVAIVSFSLLPLWEWLNFKSASAALQERTKALVEKHPELKPAWNIAMQDGKLSEAEAKEIIEGAGEKIDSQK